MHTQLDLFKTDKESDIESIKTMMEEVKESSNKVRKSLFAKNGEHSKIINDLSDRLAIIERYICKGDS